MLHWSVSDLVRLCFPPLHSTQAAAVHGERVLLQQELTPGHFYILRVQNAEKIHEPSNRSKSNLVRRRKVAMTINSKICLEWIHSEKTHKCYKAIKTTVHHTKHLKGSSENVWGRKKIVASRFSNARSQQNIQEVTCYLLSSEWHHNQQLSQTPLLLLNAGQSCHISVKIKS